MTPTRPAAPWALVALGCGTANYEVVRQLPGSPAAAGLVRVTLCDKGTVEPNNAVTCPDYADHVGRFKCDCLANLVRPRLPGPAIQAIAGLVEQIEWPQILHAPASGGRPWTFVIVGLDEWPSRLVVADDLRRFSTRGRIVLVQIGLDKDQAQVCVYGSRWTDPCPACGLGALPMSEPCVVYQGGELRRGTLRREATAAGQWVHRILAEQLGLVRPTRNWINTKTNLAATRPGSDDFDPLTRTCRRQPGCLGPHAPGADARIHRMLEPVALGKERLS